MSVTQALPTRSSRLGGFGHWNPGEIALQRIAGSEQMLARHAPRILLSSMTEQLRRFFPLLPLILVSYVDEDERPWGTILPGTPGFVWSPTPGTLRVERLPPAGDPFAAALREGASIGLLGIDLSTRRRNRVNGTVAECDATGFTVTVQQAFGNCPKYIQQRSYTAPDPPPDRIEASTFIDLEDLDARALLARADTIFVASFAPGPDRGPAMDASHRGGKPGFIKIGEGELTIPDYAGNRFFNTLGNILLTGRAGLIVPCFETGDVLVLTGDAAVGLDEDSGVQSAAIGAERLWRVRPRQGHWLRGALPSPLQPGKRSPESEA